MPDGKLNNLIPSAIQKHITGVFLLSDLTVFERQPGVKQLQIITIDYFHSR